MFVIVKKNEMGNYQYFCDPSTGAPFKFYEIEKANDIIDQYGLSGGEALDEDDLATRVASDGF